MIKVDKNIQVPGYGKGRKYKWPWPEMEIGDSFFVKANGDKPCPVGALPTHFVKSGFKILRRTVNENGVRGFRIWRVE